MDICVGLFGSPGVPSTMCAPTIRKCYSGFVGALWGGGQIASEINAEPDAVGLRRELRSGACTNADNRSVALAT